MPRSDNARLLHESTRTASRSGAKSRAHDSQPLSVPQPVNRSTVENILFLPGARGLSEYWEPVKSRLPEGCSYSLVGYPGFGACAPDASIKGIEDLVATLAKGLTAKTAVVAQSMGGVIAVKLALRCPDLVPHLVLTGLSGGVDVESLGGTPWRAAFEREYPELPTWFSRHDEDLSAGVRALQCNTLLLWGAQDAISPVAVGLHLSKLVPTSRLLVLAEADHDMPATHPVEVASAIREHLGPPRVVLATLARHPSNTPLTPTASAAGRVTDGTPLSFSERLSLVLDPSFALDGRREDARKPT